MVRCNVQPRQHDVPWCCLARCAHRGREPPRQLSGALALWASGVFKSEIAPSFAQRASSAALQPRPLAAPTLVLLEMYNPCAFARSAGRARNPEQPASDLAASLTSKARLHPDKAFPAHGGVSSTFSASSRSRRWGAHVLSCLHKTLAVARRALC